MNSFQYYWLSLLFGWTFIELIHAYGEGVCNRYKTITYTDQVYKSISKPYREYNYWTGEYVTRHKTEYDWIPKVSAQPESEILNNEIILFMTMSVRPMLRRQIKFL